MAVETRSKTKVAALGSKSFSPPVSQEMEGSERARKAPTMQPVPATGNQSTGDQKVTRVPTPVVKSTTPRQLFQASPFVVETVQERDTPIGDKKPAAIVRSVANPNPTVARPSTPISVTCRIPSPFSPFRPISPKGVPLMFQSAARFRTTPQVLSTLRPQALSNPGLINMTTMGSPILTQGFIGKVSTTFEDVHVNEDVNDNKGNHQDDHDDSLYSTSKPKDFANFITHPYKMEPFV